MDGMPGPCRKRQKSRPEQSVEETVTTAESLHPHRDPQFTHRPLWTIAIPATNEAKYLPERLRKTTVPSIVVQEENEFEERSPSITPTITQTIYIAEDDVQARNLHWQTEREKTGKTPAIRSAGSGESKKNESRPTMITTSAGRMLIFFSYLGGISHVYKIKFNVTRISQIAILFQTLRISWESTKKEAKGKHASFTVTI